MGAALAGQESRDKCRPCAPVISVPKKALSRGLGQLTPNMGGRGRKFKKKKKTQPLNKLKALLKTPLDK